MSKEVSKNARTTARRDNGEKRALHYPSESIDIDKLPTNLFQPPPEPSGDGAGVSSHGDGGGTGED